MQKKSVLNVQIIIISQSVFINVMIRCQSLKTFTIPATDMNIMFVTRHGKG